jgi:DNA-binding NarL/FixJ family response regulator
MIKDRAITVVMAEDNLLVREGVRGILAADPGLELLAVCADADALREAIAEHHPDVVVTDIHMPPGMSDEGIQVAQQLRATSPSTGVVVLSSRDDSQYAIDLLEGGAQGRAYLLKERVGVPGQLVNAVREVAHGGSVIDPRIVELLMTKPTSRTSTALAHLTPRELEVLAAMARGSNNSSIAAELFLTVRGVERHINALFGKLGLGEEPDYHRRVRAVLLYLADAGVDLEPLQRT